jgi:predicted TIM-barrel fold metal-dependent hydrolase
VLIGRFGGFDLHPLDVDIAFCQLVNDYLADTWRPYFDRVAPGIHLPIQNIEASVKELERAAGLGLRPALLPDGIFERPYFLPEWEPMWEALNDLKVPATCHVGNNAVPGKTDHGIPPGLGYIGWYDQCVAMGESLGHMVFSGVFERYPDLHVVMTEGYATWLAFAVQFWDHHWLDSRFGKMAKGQASMMAMGEWAAKIEAPPGYYLKRNCHATFMWDPIAVREREVTGLDCLLWGNDYPHREGSFPDSEAWVDKMFAGVPEEEIDQMVRGNANRIFGLNV